MAVFPLFKLRRPLGPLGTTWPSRKRHFGWSVFLDIATILLLLLLSLAFYRFIYPAKTYFRLNDPELMYPKTPVVIPSALVGALGISVPLVVIVLANVLFWWNPWDLYSGIVGLFFAWAVSLFFTGLLWVIMGEMRPFFLSICQVEPARVQQGQLYYTSDVCRNREDFTPDDLHGFPSGHGSGAFVGLVFLICYLNGKLKVFNGHGGHAWKALIAFVLPLTLAMYLSLRRLHDHSHSDRQMLFGILIGILSALFGYRTYYRSGFWFGSGEDAHLSSVQWAREHPQREFAAGT